MKVTAAYSLAAAMVGSGAATAGLTACFFGAETGRASAIAVPGSFLCVRDQSTTAYPNSCMQSAITRLYLRSLPERIIRLTPNAAANPMIGMAAAAAAPAADIEPPTNPVVPTATAPPSAAAPPAAPVAAAAAKLLRWPLRTSRSQVLKSAASLPLARLIVSIGVTLAENWRGLVEHALVAIAAARHVAILS